MQKEVKGSLTLLDLANKIAKVKLLMVEIYRKRRACKRHHKRKKPKNDTQKWLNHKHHI